MSAPPVVLACGDAEAARLLPALAAAGFAVTRLQPAQADPGRVSALAPRVLVLETGLADGAERIQAFWEDREMEEHLPVLLVHPPGPPPISPGLLDEPVDRVVSPADPREVVARVQGLILTGLIRVYRSSFHDVSQPLTIARALSQKALRLSPPEGAVHPTLVELDKQVERIFRIAEDLQRKRMG